jgi:histidine triad (HIT) family protein
MVPGSWWMPATAWCDASTVPRVASGRCVFCGVVDGSVDAAVVFRDQVAVGFLDHRPLFPGHVLVVPTDHLETIVDLPPELVYPFARRVQAIAAALPLALGAQGTFVANNNVVSQSVPHLHVHVVPRSKGDGLRGFFWPRTRYAEGEADRIAAAIAGELARIDLD